MPDANDTMPLAAKGPVRPPPTLAGPAGRVAAVIATWPNVVSATHRHLSRRDEVDGADFYRDDAELGHIHLDGEVHLATTEPLRQALVARGLARPFRWLAGWVEASIETEEEADHALWLFDLNRRRLEGVPLDRLLQDIAARSPV